jgi:ribosome hibernation promoting factor
VSEADARERPAAVPIIVNGRGITLTPALKTLIEGKITRLARVLPRIADARVVCVAEKFRRTARITLRARRRTFTSEATAGDLAAALDAAAESLKRQLREAKERRTASKGRAARRGGAVVPGPDREEIVPRRLVAKPMSIDEAKMQLDAGREQFLVFRNAQSGEVNVLYRRRDGGLGLIEPVA